jgi:hypothetical protein
MAAKKKKKNKGGKRLSSLFLALFGLATAILFISSTIILIVGMLPTLAAALSDRVRGETRALTIGSINFAGCSYYLLQLWSKGHNIENSVAMITDPTTIIVIYCAAGIGWIIDWAMSGLVATIVQQRGVSRLKDIKKAKEDLIVRWGPEVTGELALDKHGFPVENEARKLSHD